MAEEVDDIELPINFTPHEDIAACTNALACISDWDEYLMDEDERLILTEIKMMALHIIHTGLREIYISNNYGKEADTQDCPS